MEASLISRLAGPSTGKAGLAKDQTEINRIIAEASKGSPFFENEKRKDKELTEKIGRLLKHRDEMIRGIDVGKFHIELSLRLQCLSKLEIGRLEASIDKTVSVVKSIMSRQFNQSHRSSYNLRKSEILRSILYMWIWMPFSQQ